MAGPGLDQAMPELPEVETVMRGLKRAMAGRRIARVDLRRADLRFPFPHNFAKRLEGRRVEDFSRRAKYMLANIEGGDCLLLHLGMSGRFAVIEPTGKAHALGAFYEDAAPPTPGTHDHVIFELETGMRIVYSDPRRFGIMDLFPRAEADRHPLLRDIGVEP